jgi:ubiquinone/menaquinone biosynthesis C-methylase UbiE
LIAWALGRYLPRASSFLEVGCGNGFVLAGLQACRPDLRIAGTDLYAEGLRTARMRLPHVPLVQADACHLPIARKYDAVGIFDVLEHIDDDRRVLNELFRVLQPGGGLLVTVPQHRVLWSPMDDLACHRRRYSRRELIEKVSSAGFRITRVSSFVSLLLPIMFAARFGRQKADVDGELNLPRGLDRALQGVMDIERALIRMGVSWPAGGSLLLVGTRP